MATDLPISGLPVVTTVNATDLATLVRPGDPAGTKNKQITFDNLTASISALGWGGTRVEGGAGGIGLLHTISANAASGTISFQTILDNTQSNALVAHSIDLGTSVLGHTGLDITAQGDTTSQKAININMGAGAGTGIEVGGSDDFIGFHVAGATSDVNHIGYKYSSTTQGNVGIAFYTDINVSGSNNHIPFYANVVSGQENFNRTTDLFTLFCVRPHQNGVARTDNFNMAYIKRNISGVDSFSQGTVLKLENISASVTDTVNVLEIIQSVNSTGVPISITQNAVVSTNFKRIQDSAGVTLWISDGTTPNGALSGTAGDVCFNGSDNQIFYCKGGTVWELDGVVRISQSFVNLDTTPVAIPTFQKNSQYSITIEDSSVGHSGIFILTTGLDTGSAFSHDAFGASNLSISESPAGTFTITVGGGHTYVLAINVGNNTATFATSSGTASGTTTLILARLTP